MPFGLLRNYVIKRALLRLDTPFVIDLFSGLTTRIARSCLKDGLYGRVSVVGGKSIDLTSVESHYITLEKQTSGRAPCDRSLAAITIDR